MKWHAQAREAGGKAKLRNTSPAVACAVVSWPEVMTDGWSEYAADVLKFFAATYGPECLVGVVEHFDEAHPHMHVYMVPRIGDVFGTIHPGYKASRAARKKPGRHVTVAYKAAMSAWQDDLFAATGHKHGLERFGPRRSRLNRWELNARKRASEAAEAETAEVFAKAKKQTADAAIATQRARQAIEEAGNVSKTARNDVALLSKHPNSELAKKLKAAEARIAELEKLFDEADFRNRMAKEAEDRRRVSSVTVIRHAKPFD